MPVVERFEPGTFCWADVGTTDLTVAREFYGDILGWTAEQRPADEWGMEYTLFFRDGRRVAGLYAMNQEMLDLGIPCHWMSFIAVADVDDSARRAGELGGTVIKSPFPVADRGRMAVISDPGGAVFSLWQPAAHSGAQRVGDPGSVCWSELMTPDRERARSFYGELFSWTSRDERVGDTDYTLFLSGEAPSDAAPSADVMVAGMIELGPEVGDAPPCWMTYLAVDDCDAVASRAQARGARLIVPPRDIPTVGRFSVLSDPRGAAFAIIRLGPSESCPSS